MRLNRSDALAYLIALPMAMIIWLSWMLMIDEDGIIRVQGIHLLDDPKVLTISTLDLDIVLF
jgi:hypothetical protein